MALTVSLIPGKQFATEEALTVDKLNQLGRPTFAISGTLGTSELADKTITAAKTVPDSHFYTASVTFSAGVYTLTYSPAPTVVDGTVVVFKANANNTGATQLTVGATAGKKLFKLKTEALANGDIVTNQIVEARYESTGDGGAGAWQMLSPLARAAGYYSGAATGTNAYAVTVTPPASAALTFADIEGVPIRLKVPNTNTGAVTLNLTIGGVALGARDVRKHFNAVLAGSDWTAGDIVEVVYAAVPGYFIFKNPSAAPPLQMLPGYRSARGLYARSKDGVLGNTSATVTADDLILRHVTTGATVRHAGVSFEVSLLDAQGLNGPDFGGAAPSGWVYLWAVSNGAAIGGLWSPSPTTPTRSGTAAGYDYIALVCPVFNPTAGGNLRKFVQSGPEVWTLDVNVLTTAASTSIVSVNLATFIPPGAVAACGFAFSSSSTALQGLKVKLGPESTLTHATNLLGAAPNGSVTMGMSSSSTWRIPIITDQLMYWQSGDSAAVYNVVCNGFTLR